MHFFSTQFPKWWVFRVQFAKKIELLVFANKKITITSLTIQNNIG